MVKMSFTQHGITTTKELDIPHVNIYEYLELCRDIAVGATFHPDSFDRAVEQWHVEHQMFAEPC